MRNPNVLVLGNESREQAIVEALQRSHGIGDVFWYPGNGITGFVGVRPKLRSSEMAHIVDSAAMLKLANFVNAELTVMGPELPFTTGIADAFAAAGKLFLGPKKLAARLETSKAWAKNFMKRHRIPTAAFEVFETPESACEYCRSQNRPLVIKGDGLAGGKAVIVCDTLEQQIASIDTLMVKRIYGAAGDVVVIEEKLEGEEVSAFYLVSVNGNVLDFDSAGDHKREFDGERGRNTGGMGAFGPHPAMVKDPMLRAGIMDEIARPVIQGMLAEGYPFCGFLYVGLILTADGPKVLEFNVRLGKPEAEVILPRLRSDAYALFHGAAAGYLDEGKVSFGGKAVGVILATRLYPDKEDVRLKIDGPIRPGEMGGDIHVYHGTTAREGDDIVATGGRALTVVAKTISGGYPIDLAYGAVSRIQFEGMRYRSDIGKRAVRA